MERESKNRTGKGEETMIKKVKNNYEYQEYDVSCDRCSTGSESIEALDWGDMLSQLRDLKWKFTNKSGSWEHICPDCEV